MYYFITELQSRPDDLVNSSITARSSFATGLALFYSRAAAAVTTTDYTAVSLTLQDQNGTIIKNELFETQYEATEE